ELDGSNLVVTLGSSSITIRGWSDGDLGITLEEGDTENESPDCFASPIVLDLDGDGVEINALSNSVAFFDIDMDGVAERTAWVAPDDGLLAWDINGDGEINDASELFGYQMGDALSGFDRLALLDDNADGELNALDAAYADLLVWRDLNGNGQSTEKELFSLAEVGVASIALNAAQVNEDIADSRVSDRSTLTTTEGETREALDVWFRFNQFDARFDAPEEIDPAILDLPDIRGNGSVADLHIAMATDPVLREKVEALTELTAADLGRLPQLVNEIIFRWTGTEDIPVRSRGENVDGRMIAVTEAFADTPFRQGGSQANPRPNAGGELMTQFDEINRDITLKLLAQVPLGDLVFPEFDYVANAFMLLEDGATSVDFLDRIAAEAPIDPDDEIAHWVAAIRLADAVYLSFDDVKAANDGGAGYRAQVEEIFRDLGVNGDYQTLVAIRVGGDGADVILTSGAYYGLRADPVDIILAGEGDDVILANGGANQVFWGEGQGNDEVFFRTLGDHDIRLRG
ncbi:MAG: hypothetical protein AAFU55_11785, partial [Pseudomonadota bacterium]